MGATLRANTTLVRRFLADDDVGEDTGAVGTFVTGDLVDHNRGLGSQGGVFRDD